MIRLLSSMGRNTLRRALDSVDSCVHACRINLFFGWYRGLPGPPRAAGAESGYQSAEIRPGEGLRSEGRKVWSAFRKAEGPSVRLPWQLSMRATLRIKKN